MRKHQIIACHCDNCKHGANRDNHFRKYMFRLHNRELRRKYKQNLKHNDDTFIILSVGYTD